MINEAVFAEFPVLESDRLIFRAFIQDDASDILSIRSNKEVMRFMGGDHHTSLADANKFVKENISAHKNKTGICWAIIEKSTNEFLGDFSYWKLDRTNHRGEIGYTLKPDF